MAGLTGIRGGVLLSLLQKAVDIADLLVVH